MTYPTISPELTLDFAKSEQLDPRIAFTRSSTGTYLDSNGLIKTAPSGVARFDYDSSGKALGLLMEESRTNVASRSQEFTNSAWFKTGMTATDNVAVAPDGTTTAATLMDNGTDNVHHGLYQAQASRTDFTQSFFVKPNGNNYVNLRASTSTFDWHTITFALIGDGSVTQSLAGSNSPYTNVSGTIIALANGWYRISMSGTRSAGNAYVLNLDAATGPTETLSANYGLQATYTSNTSKGYYIWGGQLEEEVFLTSYIPTTSSTVTRAADLATMPTAGIYGDDFTTINKDFGTVGGSDTLTIVGPNAERTVVYPEHLTQAQINKVTTAEDDDFLRMRVLGSSFALTTVRTDGSLTVDWGDGTVETLTTAEHTFTNGSGYHEIGLRLDSGTYFSPNFNGDATNAAKVIAVGPCPSNMLIEARPFAKCVNMEVCDATFVQTGTLLTYTFRNNHKIKSIPFYTTSSTAAQYTEAFRNCYLITSFPSIDLSNGTGFARCWGSCSSLESFPKIDMSSATDLIDAWSSCSSLTSFPAIDFPNVWRFRNAWKNCSGLTSFPLIDTSSGTQFLATWRGCSSLTSFPLIDTSSGTDFNSAWMNCSSLTSFPLIDTSSGTDFRYAWSNCSSLTSFPLINTSNSTGSFTDTWLNCSSLTSFPAIVCNGSSYNEAWSGCTSLTTFPANMFDSTQITVGKGHGNSWNSAWKQCALTAQSIENILVSLDTNGASNCQVGIQGGTNAGQSTWTTAATTAYNNLITKGWTIDANP